MKDLSAVPKQEQEEFLNSFDHVLCDVDGVLWVADQPIPGAVDALNSLKKLGKTVTFVTNNNTKPFQLYFNQLKAAGIENLQEKDLIQPVRVMISYLRSINFNKEIYLVGMTPMRLELEMAGFKVADYGPEEQVDSVAKYIKLALDTSPEVGAVIADIDVNLKMYRLQRAVTYLHNPDVIFITGGSDRTLQFDKGVILTGPGCFHGIIEDMTGRRGHCLAKPGSGLNDFIREQLKFDDPKRILFIGDSVPEDMGFATKFCYKKLLVLSGLTGKDSLTDWAFPEEFKPDYYVDSLQNVHNLIK